MKPALIGDTPIPGTSWSMITGPAACTAAVNMARLGPVSCDVETFGLGADSWRLKVVVVSDGKTVAVLDPREPQQHAAIADALDAARQILMWNSPFDAPILCQNKLLKVDDLHKISDGLIHARLANPDPFVSKALEAVADRLKVHSKGTPIAQTFKELGLSKKDGFHKFDIDRADYLFGAALDGIVTFQLAPLVREEARKRLVTNPYQKFRTPDIDALIEREQIVNRVMLRRACLGIRVDFDFAETYRVENASHIAKLESEIKSVGVKPGDGASLLKWMDDEGLIGEDHPRTPTGRLQATAKVLEGMEHPLAQLFVESKQKTRLDRDYLARMEDLSKPTGGRVHPQTNIFAAITGRMSMSNPPIQQFPAGARGIFMADEGKTLASIDISQIEPYIAASMAGDFPVLRDYEQGADGDIYTTIAEFASLRGAPMSRSEAKTVVLGLLYGMGMEKLSKNLGLDYGAVCVGWNGKPSYEFTAARAIRDRVFEVMPATEEMSKNIKKAAQRNRCVPTISGRIVPMKVFKNKETDEEEVGTAKAFNAVCQGSAYDVLSAALVRVHAAGLADAVMFSVHDEIVCEADAARDIQRIMEEPLPELERVTKRTPRIKTELKLYGESWGK